MKGGFIHLDNSRDIINDLTQHIHQDSVSEFGGNSVGGYIYEVGLNDDTNLISIFPGIGGGGDEIIKKTKKIIVKLVQINRGYNIDRTSISIINGKQKEISSRQAFNNEIEIQTDVYNRSIQTYLEPICPKIIDSGVINRENFNDYEHTFFHQNITLHDQIMDCFNYQPFGYPDTIDRIGYIIMEMVDNSEPIKNIFPDDVNYTMLNDERQIILNNYIYQLMRLFNIGYIHGDTHLGNALYIDNYNYIDNYRVFILDFGRTKHIEDGHNILQFDHIILSLFQPHINGGVFPLTDFPQILTPEQAYHSYRPLYRYAYNYICSNVETATNWYTAQINKRKESKRSFINYIQTTMLNFFNIHQMNTQGLLQDINLVPEQFFIENHITFINNTIGFINSLKANHNEFNCIKNLDNITQHVCIDNHYKYYDQTIINYLYNPIHYRYSYYKNKDINNFNDESGVFLWIIGKQPGDVNCNIYFMLVENIHLFTFHHYILSQIYNINEIYAAGELFKKNNQELYYNLNSKTYTEKLLENGTITIDRVNFLKIHLGNFMKFVLNDNIRSYQINYTGNDNSFINRDLFCYKNDVAIHSQNDIIKKQDDFMKRINSLLNPPVFILCNDRQGGSNFIKSKTKEQKDKTEEQKDLNKHRIFLNENSKNLKIPKKNNFNFEKFKNDVKYKKYNEELLFNYYDHINKNIDKNVFYQNIQQINYFITQVSKNHLRCVLHLDDNTYSKKKKKGGRKNYNKKIKTKTKKFNKKSIKMKLNKNKKSKKLINKHKNKTSKKKYF